MSALRSRWAAGQVTYGGWCSIPSTVTAEVMGRAGFDHVCVDLQHGLVSAGDLVPMLQAIELGGTVPLVRVPWNEPGVIGRALDGGAMGVVVPMVSSAEEAEAAVAACFYAPAGARSYGPTRFRLAPGGDYYERANDEVACIVMIETVAALAALDDVLAVPGVTAAYVGPADLSISLGLAPGNNDGETAFDDALAAVVAGCRRAGVVPGIHATAGLAERRVDAGFQLVTVTNDLVALTAAVHADRASLSRGV